MAEVTLACLCGASAYNSWAAVNGVHLVECTKCGIVPFHIWLPDAHPAAPSHVSALMSGVMIKTGIYMMIRIFFGMLWPVPVWWGLSFLFLPNMT